MPTSLPTNTQLPAVVIGIDCVTGLQIARILSSYGTRVIGIAGNRDHYCCKTNSCERILAGPTKGRDLIDLLREHPELQEEAVLIPISDLAVLALSEHRDDIPTRHRFLLPERSTLDLLVDKAKFLRHAEEHGLPIPPALVIHNREDASQAAGKLKFPIAIKPPVKTRAWESNTKAKVYIANNANELLSTYDTCGQWTNTLLAQEWLVGNEDRLFQAHCYFDQHGREVATVCTRKLRQWPTRTGTGCLSETVENERVADLARRVFRLLDLRGFGYLEAKYDPTVDDYVIVEPNVGRPTGRTSTLHALGIDIVRAAYCELAGLELPSMAAPNRLDMKWIHWRRDLQAAFWMWRRKELSVSEWLRSLRGPKYTAVWSRRDPKPFFADFTRHLKRLSNTTKPSAAIDAKPASEATS